MNKKNLQIMADKIGIDGTAYMLNYLITSKLSVYQSTLRMIDKSTTPNKKELLSIYLEGITSAKKYVTIMDELNKALGIVYPSL